MKKVNLKFCLLLLASVWAFLTFFTIAWDLPSKYTPEPDGITAQLNFSAREMMKADTYKYPPLQYIIADAVTEKIKEQTLTPEKLEIKRSQRIIIYRMLSAIMGLGTAVFIFLAGYYFFNCLPVYSLAASLFFLLLSPVIYYSQSSNMDIPACFWFAGSIFFAILAEYKYGRIEDRKAYFIIHLIAGIFIGCAFCTKDQVYALYILPATAFCYWKWREKHSILNAIVPCCIWGMSFLTTVILIYSIISWEVFLPHLFWIIGDGASPYAVVGKGLWARTTLCYYSLQDLGKAMDLPLIILFFAFAFMVYKRREKYIKDIVLVYSSIFFILLILSQFLFFGQIVRYSQIRYFIPALPFLLLLLFYVFQKEMAANKYKNHIGVFVICIFIFQCGIAVNFLCRLNNSPLAQLKNELSESSIYKDYRINTAMAEIDARYLQRKDGSQEKLKCIRPWGIFLGLEKYGIKDIFPDELSLYLLAPHILISSKEIPLFEKHDYILKKKYETIPQIFFSLYKNMDKRNFFLYVKETPTNIILMHENSFKKSPLEIQIIKLNYLISIHPDFSLTEMNYIGQNLAPFTPPDSKKYLINNYMYKVLFDAYNVAGRKEDAKKCYDFYVSNKKLK